jgi:hypothetical protein
MRDGCIARRNRSLLDPESTEDRDQSPLFERKHGDLWMYKSKGRMIIIRT